MATAAQLVAAGHLIEYELPDWEQRLPIRPLYVHPDIREWIDATAVLHERSAGAGGRSLAEHIAQMFCDYRCSKRPGAGDLRRMLPTKHGVWTMRPPRIRIYGLSPAPHQFVAIAAALESETKSDRRLNDRKRDEVRTFARQHSLVFLRGDINAILPR